MTLSRGNQLFEILGVWKLLLQFAASSGEVPAGGIDDLIRTVVRIHEAILGISREPVRVIRKILWVPAILLLLFLGYVVYIIY